MTEPDSAPTSGQPLLKWAGGKRWLAPALTAVLKLHRCDFLVEPFIGGGAFFFFVGPRRARLGDTNADLIACYRGIRDSPDDVIAGLQSLNIDRTTFQRLAAQDPDNDVDKAIRLVFLNRTAFGGLWRVNRKGQFNVPYGCKPETQLPNTDSLSQVSLALQQTDLYVGDFSVGFSSSEACDFFYCDPPYTVAHNNNGFIRYNERLFSWADQHRLAGWASQLAQRGQRVAVSNAAHHDVIALYRPRDFIRLLITRSSRLAADPKYRGARDEALFISRNTLTNGIDVIEALGHFGVPVRLVD